MIFRTVTTAIAVLFATVAAAHPGSPPAQTSIQSVVPAGNIALIRRDTPIVLMAVKEVSTADVTPGTIFKLRVHQSVVVDGKTVIPIGTPAFGTVLTATDSGGLGKSGRMTAKLLHIQLGNAEIPLEGETSAKGTGAGSAGVAVIFAGVAGLFHRGNNAKIKAGELLAGFVAEDVFLDLSANPVTRAAAPTPLAPVQP